MPKVSVIVPVYQTEKYIRKCLQSLVDQTLCDIEIIVINDGSTDGSQSIIDEYSLHYATLVRSFYKENGGLSAARNFGINHATGDFIGFVDSDDEVSPTMFEDLYKLALKHDAEISFCNLQKVDENGKIIQQLPQAPHLDEKIVLAEELSAFSDLSYFACNKIFKNVLFEKLRFKSKAHFEDIELIPKLVLKCKVLAHSTKYHYQYLERNDSITKTHSLKGLDILSAVESVTDFYQTTAFNESKIALKNFQILEGVYTFLAYTAFVKDKFLYQEMNRCLLNFRRKHLISTAEILRYKRFGKNYLLSLPLKKQLYYLLCFSGLYTTVRKLL